MYSKNYQDFKVLQIRFSHTSTSYHNLFLKEHSVRHVDENKPPGKTLFIVNIPPYATKSSIKQCFSIAGNVRSIIFETLDTEVHVSDYGFKRGYVVFDRRESLLKIMKLDTLGPLSSDELPLKIGLASWTEEYNSAVYDPKKLHNKISTFMAKYDKTEEKERNKKNIVDDEGWTVITKKGRHPGIDRKESVENKLKEKLKKKELKNFYTFQIRESKMENIAALRKSFEEAKNKVNLMKQARKFKPY